MIKSWTDAAWADYIWWQSQDRKTLKRINQLVKDIDREPFDGIGKPEPLKDDLSGLWSRRIDAANRIVYSVSGEVVTFYSVKDHYSDK
ncbi:Txe/YoeB family addiction module toxin [Collinsella provencensis]|uniref:Txe/YoeB family addiction module toxin n=1 Tax=Collinsella provencensis TaxID=1937461 RepID=UPI000C849884|nr:Txe/YoeB family addiction module toxin [Collinsella provencensis]